MDDFVIEKCEEKDAEEIREIAKSNNYFNPDYKDLKEGGFTGTVYNSEVVKKILGLGHSYKISYRGEILAYFLGIDGDSYSKVYPESLDEMYEGFFNKKGKLPGKVIYFAQAAVRPPFKGRGIARELFNFSKSEWKKQGFNMVYGEIASHNEGSKRFWELVGLVKIAEKKWEGGVLFKGCDEKWIKENLEILRAKKDPRVDKNLLGKLKIFLYRYSLD